MSKDSYFEMHLHIQLASRPSATRGFWGMRWGEVSEGVDAGGKWGVGER